MYHRLCGRFLRFWVMCSISCVTTVSRFTRENSRCPLSEFYPAWDLSSVFILGWIWNSKSFPSELISLVFLTLYQIAFWFYAYLGITWFICWSVLQFWLDKVYFKNIWPLISWYSNVGFCFLFLNSFWCKWYNFIFWFTCSFQGNFAVSFLWICFPGTVDACSILENLCWIITHL